MRKLASVLGLGIGLAVASGCDNTVTNDDGESGGAGGSASQTTGAVTTGTGGSPGNWVPIITADWQLDAGSENTSDVHSITVDHDVYIGGIRPIAPKGTHHTVLAIGGLGAGNIIYASGVGTNELLFPKGVGLKLAAGETLVLQLHLFNPTANAMTGTSGVEIIEVPAAELKDEADLFLPGPMSFSIPPNEKWSKASTCTVNAQQNIFAIFPHMHQLGSHFKTTVTIGGVDNVIHDGDYSFDHQAFIPFEALTLNPGDSVTTECTWDNTTQQTVSWGESSTTEMCFSILYRYPAQSDAGFCGQ